MYKSKYVYITAFSVIIFLAIAVSVSAEDSSENSTSNKTKNFTRVCDKINEIVSLKLQRFDDGHVRRINAYNNMQNRIENLIAKLEARGANTTQISADYENLTLAIETFKADYETYIKKLKSLQNYTCGSSEGAFKSALRDAKAMLPILRADAKAINVQLKELKDSLHEIRIDKMESRSNKTTNGTNPLKERLEDARERAKNRSSRSNETENDGDDND